MEVWKGFWFSGCQYKMSVSKTVFVESFHFHFDENLHFIFSNFYFSVFNQKSSASSVKSADHRGELVKELRWHYINSIWRQQDRTKRSLPMYKVWFQERWRGIWFSFMNWTKFTLFSDVSLENAMRIWSEKRRLLNWIMLKVYKKLRCREKVDSKIYIYIVKIELPVGVVTWRTFFRQWVVVDVFLELWL